MKRLLIFSILVAIVSLISCTEQEELPLFDGEHVSFNLVIDDKIETTRTDSYRYIIEVYHGDDVSTNPVHHIEQDNGNFTLSLNHNANYVCLFWIDSAAPYDNENGSFDASSLKDVKLIAGKDVAEAFFTNKSILTGNSNATSYIVLKRAVAQVNLIELGTVAAHTNLRVDCNHHTSFNAFSGDVVGSAVAMDKTFNSAETTGELGTFFIFAPKDNYISADFTFTFGTNAAIIVSSVEIQANHITNITGQYGVAQSFRISIAEK